MTRRARTIWLCAAIGALAGCAGSGPGERTQNGSFVTRDADTRYSQDSLLLASLAAADPWIPLDLATDIETDLTAIRSAYPDLAAIHARPSNEPKTLLVTLKPGAAATAWRAGMLHTGDAGLDTFLGRYNATAVRPLLGDTFVVTFAQWLNTVRLAPLARAASDAVLRVSQNGMAGDGDQIQRAVVGGVRGYTFSKGWGDCPAGCISRHAWKVTIATDGSLSVTESGAALP